MQARAAAMQSVVRPVRHGQTCQSTDRSLSEVQCAGVWHVLLSDVSRLQLEQCISQFIGLLFKNGPVGSSDTSPTR
jgi:hypothetical protein